MADGHARCPADGCVDAAPMQEAHTGPRGIEPPRTPYVADRREGGCGNFWFETSAAAAHNDRNRGINPKHLKENARVGRYFSEPSDAYRENYDRAFGRTNDAENS